MDIVCSDGGKGRKSSEVKFLVDLLHRQMEASRQCQDCLIQLLERIGHSSVQLLAARAAGEGGVVDPGPALGAPLTPYQGR